MRKILAAGFCLACGGAQAGVYAIDWTSNDYPCLPGVLALGRGPIVSGWYPCTLGVGANAVAVSICPQPTMWPYPWDHGAAIRVIGGSITAEPSSPDILWSAEVGSGHGGDGPDVFIRGAGRGPGVAQAINLGLGFPQGTASMIAGYPGAHFDLYDACAGAGSIHYRVSISYVSLP